VGTDLGVGETDVHKRRVGHHDRGILSCKLGHRALEGDKIRHRFVEADRQEVSAVVPVTGKDLSPWHDEQLGIAVGGCPLFDRRQPREMWGVDEDIDRSLFRP